MWNEGAARAAAIGWIWLVCSACGDSSSGTNSDNSSAGSSNAGSSNDSNGQAANGGSATISPSPNDDDDDERFDSCQSFDVRRLPEPEMPTGSAHLSVPAEGDLPAIEADITEVTCETLHDATGNVVGYAASFFSTWESTTFTPLYAAVSWSGEFTGDGSYDEARLIHSSESESINRSEGTAYGTLALTEGGRAGTFTEPDGASLTFTCQDTSKIFATSQPPPAETPPGTLRYSSEGEPLYTFTGIQCGTAASGDFEIATDLDSPFYVRILLQGNGTGTHNTDDFDVRYAGITSSSEGGRINLECGFPSRGTIEFGGVNNGVWRYQGEFNCPE